jgi:hypothetical protein
MIGAIRSVFYEGRNDDVQLIICLINPEGMVDSECSPCAYRTIVIITNHGRGKTDY